MIDQAQHFAALGQSGDSTLAFREGLEVTEREREYQITVIPTAGYISGFEKYSHSRRKAQRRPNSGTSLRIGYDGDGVFLKRPTSANFGVTVIRASSSSRRSFVMMYELVPPFGVR